MSSNAFTKKYLTELIDSRLAAIKDPADAGQSGDEKLLRQMYRDNAVEHAKAALSPIRAAGDAIENLLMQYKIEPTDDLARQMESQLSRLDNLRFNRRDVHPRNVVLEVEERIRKARQKAGGSNPGGEASRLERVKKYIEESPAEEFSLTLMRSLGFLDIIKFAINN